jgi:hypothetical protein
MSNDPRKDSLGYPFDDRHQGRRAPSDPRTGCSFIVLFYNVLESRLRDLVQYWDGKYVGWSIFGTKPLF